MAEVLGLVLLLGRTSAAKDIEAGASSCAPRPPARYGGTGAREAVLVRV
jgi:hypothetical protein